MKFKLLHKRIALLICILLFFFCAACANANVHYGLSDNNYILREYDVELKSVELEARTYADSIADYWRNDGLTANINRLDASLLISGESQILFKDRESAVKDFSDLLGGEDSLLRNVVFEYHPSYELDEFSLSASIMVDDVIRQNEVQDIPSQDLDELLSNAQNGEYTFSVSLPGEIVSTNADVILGQKYTWNVVYGKETQIELKTQIVNATNIAVYEQLQQEKQQGDMIFKIAVIAAGSIILTLILIFVILKVRSRSY